MSSLFEALSEFDRPYVEFTVTIHGREHKCFGRLPSAREQDAMDAAYLEQFSTLTAEYSTPKDGKPSDLEIAKSAYGARSKTNIINQLLDARGAEVRQRAYDIMGVDLGAEIDKINAMEDGPDKKAYQKERNTAFQDAVKKARKEIAQEDYEHLSQEDLVDKIAQLDITLRATNKTMRDANSLYCYYSLYDENHNRVFKSPEEVRENLSTATIENICTKVRKVLQAEVDRPFESPDGPVPDGQPLSSDTSEADTKIGGEPTTTTPENSKLSTTPA